MINKRRRLILYSLIIALLIFAGNSIAQAAIYFDQSFAGDGVAETNPQEGVPVASYQLDTNQVFFAAVSAIATDVIAGTEGTLTVWNSSKNLTYKSVVRYDGQIAFAVGLPYSAEG